MNEWQDKYDPAWAGGSCEWCGAADGVACEADCPDILNLIEQEKKFYRERMGVWYS